MPRIDLTPSGIGARLLHTRWFVRAPIPLYRHGLGRVLGRRVLMVEHTGRHTGLPRYVCLEAVEHAAPGHLVIVSGFGRNAQWFRNLTAHPECYVSWGSVRRAPAVARFLTESQSRAVIERYAARYPASWAVLRSTIEKASDTQLDALPMVELVFDERRRHRAGKAT